MEHKGTKYQAFRNWFSKYKNLLEEINLNHPITGEIDKQINALGDFAWEIGIGIHKPFSFTISPGRNGVLLEITKKIISHAPEAKEWEFYYAKPSKDIKEFDFLLDGKRNHVDISEWEYVLFQYEDGKFGLDVRPSPYFEYYTDDQHGIVDMVLCSLIGEEDKIQKIAEYAVVEEFESDVLKNKSLIISLPANLKRLASG